MKRAAVLILFCFFIIATCQAEVLVPGWWNGTIEGLESARQSIDAVLKGTEDPNHGLCPSNILTFNWMNESNESLKAALMQIEHQIFSLGGSANVQDSEPNMVNGKEGIYSYVPDKYAIINAKGEQLTGFKWDDVTFSDDYAIVFVGKTNGIGTPEEGKYGLIDKSGNLVLQVEWDGLTNVDSNTLGICKEDKWGCYDLMTNQMIVPLEYDYIQPFAGEYAVGFKGTLSGIIGKYPDQGVYYFLNRNNEVISSLSNVGFVTAQENGIAHYRDYFTSLNKIDSIKYHWFNIKTGKTYSNYNAAAYSSEKNILAVLENEKYGFIDFKGDLIVPYIFDSVPKFDNGRAIAKINGKYVIIDESFTVVKELEYDYVSDFNNGRAYGFKGTVEEGHSPQTGLYCLIDFEGDRVGEMREFDSTAWPDNQVWWVERGGKYTIIDMSGNYVANHLWEDTYGWANLEGMTVVSNGEKYGVVDRTGKTVIDYNWDLIVAAESDMFALCNFSSTYDVRNENWEMTKEQVIQNEGTDYLYVKDKEYDYLIYFRKQFGVEWDVLYKFSNDNLYNVSFMKINSDGKSTLSDFDAVCAGLEETYGKSNFLIKPPTEQNIDIFVLGGNLGYNQNSVVLFSAGYSGRHSSILFMGYFYDGKVITSLSFSPYYSEDRDIVSELELFLKTTQGTI